MSRVLGVIPARLESHRLPRKALRRICGRPMIVRVYERACPASCLDRLLVATDSEEILACCRENKIPAQMTSAEHRSGTDRLVEVMSREPADIYVNIQGDEPMVTPEHIDTLITAPRDQVGRGRFEGDDTAVRAHRGQFAAPLCLFPVRGPTDQLGTGPCTLGNCGYSPQPARKQGQDRYPGCIRH